MSTARNRLIEWYLKKIKKHEIDILVGRTFEVFIGKTSKDDLKALGRAVALFESETNMDVSLYIKNGYTFARAESRVTPEFSRHLYPEFDSLKVGDSKEFWLDRSRGEDPEKKRLLNCLRRKFEINVEDRQTHLVITRLA